MSTPARCCLGTVDELPHEEWVKPEHHCLHWTTGGRMRPHERIEVLEQQAQCCWCGRMFLAVPAPQPQIEGHGRYLTTRIGEPIGDATVTAH